MKKLLLALAFVACLARSEVSPEPRIGVTAMPVGVGDAGTPPVIDPTGVLCSEAALQALIQPNPAFVSWFGPTIDLPYGKLRLCGPLVISSTVRVRGNGAQLFIAYADLGFDALTIEATAPHTALENLEIKFNAGTAVDHESIGIRVEAPQVILRDVAVFNAGSGVVAVAGSGENVNLQRWDNVIVSACKRVGVELSGVDASGGVLTGLNVQGCIDPRGAPNKAVGMLEASANGNLQLGSNLESSQVSLRVAPTGGMAPSTFVGVYVEAGDPVEWVGGYSAKTTILGGQLAIRSEPKGDKFGAGHSRAIFRATSASGSTHLVHLPAPDYDAAMLLVHNYSAAETWMLRAQPAPVGTSRWGFQHFFSQGLAPVGFEATGSAAKARIEGQMFCDAVIGCAP